MLRLPLLTLLLTLILVSPGPSYGQGVGGAGGGAAGGGAAGGGGGAGGGIKIDPEGVVSLAIVNDGPGLLDKKRREATAKKSLSHDINQRTKRRFVSLVELERQLDQTLLKQLPIPNELFYLAGLQRLDQIFVFPDEGDLVIAGPAEGFAPDAVGRMIGVESSRPTLRLDDLLVAMRTVLKSKQLGCSIDPVPQRLAEFHRFVQEGGPASVEVVEDRFNQMDDILGLQDVRIDGVPADSHFATVLVEADYRMKLIAIGLENPRVKGLKSHLAMLGTNSATMQRRWFVPSYDFISRSADGLAFQLSGQRVKLLTEEEIADENGNRSSSANINKSAQAFAKQFTAKFPQLADKSAVFGELQNLIDWSVFAALLNSERIPERIGWKRNLLLDEQRLTYPVFAAPKKVPSQLNYKRDGNLIVGLVSGGVIINPQQIYEQSISVSRGPALDETRSKVSESPRVDMHRWWWDAE